MPVPVLFLFLFVAGNVVVAACSITLYRPANSLEKLDVEDAFLGVIGILSIFASTLGGIFTLPLHAILNGVLSLLISVLLCYLCGAVTEKVKARPRSSTTS